MRFVRRTTGYVLASLALWAALLGASISWAQEEWVIVQKRPLFHDLSRVNSYASFDSIIESTKPKSTRGQIGQWLEGAHILDPQKKTTLSIKNPCDNSNDLIASWEFPKGHYFRQDIPLVANEISVIAWRTFPIIAKVKCDPADEFQTYSTWVPVDRN